MGNGPIPIEEARKMFPKTWRYRLNKIIGKGKVTTVYAGEEIRCQVGRKVAVKCFHLPDDVPDHEVEREAAALRKLQHPNIICFLELARANTTKHLFIAMELVEDGLSLESVVCNFLKEALQPCVLAKWVTELVGAVQHIHENDVIHRDISPKNILVGGKVPRCKEEKAAWVSLTMKLGDFGSSKILPEGHNVANTLIAADHSYMAPEIVAAYKEKKGAVRHDRTVDYWSLGAVIIFLANRRHLMRRAKDPSDMKKMSIRISDDIDKAKERAKYPPTGIGQDFWELCIQAIDKVPRKRPLPSKYLESAFIKKIQKEAADAAKANAATTPAAKGKLASSAKVQNIAPASAAAKLQMASTSKGNVTAAPAGKGSKATTKPETGAASAAGATTRAAATPQGRPAAGGGYNLRSSSAIAKKP